MSKSKSRQPSRQLAAASRNGANGSARTAAPLHKSTAKVAVEDVSENTEQDEATETLAVEEASETTEEEASPARVLKAATGKTSASSTEETSTATKTAKAASGKAAPAKAPTKAVPNTPAPRFVPNTPASVSGRQSRDAAKYERRQAERQMRYLAERRKRRNRIIAVLSIILALAVIGGGTFYIVHQVTTSTAQAKAGQGTYQEPIYNSTYPPVESVYCDQLEQSVEHIHAYVAIYINGQASPLPADVGIAQDSSGNATCFYWLHTHDTSGVIHIESPSTEVFTFGQFRDVWDQQFQSLGFPTELLLNTGWKIWVNGKVYNGSLASIPLDAHNIITLAYNSPNVKPVTTYAWNGL